MKLNISSINPDDTFERFQLHNEYRKYMPTEERPLKYNKIYH